MSYKFLAKNGPTIAFALFVVCVVISLIPIIGGLSAFSGVAAERQAYSAEGGIFLAGIYLSVILFLLAVLMLVFSFFYQVASDPKASVKALISFGIIAVVFIILYALADAKGTGAVAGTIERFAIGEIISKTISAGIQLSVIMLLGSFAVAIVMEIWNYFKNQ